MSIKSIFAKYRFYRFDILIALWLHKFNTGKEQQFVLIPDFEDSKEWSIPVIQK